MNSPIEKKNNNKYFRDIDNIIYNIDSFEKYYLNNKKKKNQLFSKEQPPLELVKKIIFELINKELNDNIYYQFSIKNLSNKKIIDKINSYVPELKKYYLKCKHNKYLENLDDKKIITLFRQILRPYDFAINAYEKYDNGHKYLLYVIEKKKNLNNLNIKKINSIVNFD